MTNVYADKSMSSDDLNLAHFQRRGNSIFLCFPLLFPSLSTPVLLCQANLKSILICNVCFDRFISLLIDLSSIDCRLNSSLSPLLVQLCLLNPAEFIHTHTHLRATPLTYRPASRRNLAFFYCTLVAVF